MNTKFRDIVIKHYQNPSSFGFTNSKNAIKERYNSEFCVDDLTLEVVFEKQIIKSAKFEGVACTVSTSAMDLLCLELESKTKQDAKEIITKFKKMIQNSKPKIQNELNNLGYFGLVANQPNRVRCAMIPVKLFTKVL